MKEIMLDNWWKTFGKKTSIYSTNCRKTINSWRTYSWNSTLSTNSIITNPGTTDITIKSKNKKIMFGIGGLSLVIIIAMAVSFSGFTTGTTKIDTSNNVAISLSIQNWF